MKAGQYNKIKVAKRTIENGIVINSLRRAANSRSFNASDSEKKMVGMIKYQPVPRRFRNKT
jgi:hypothetical protein